MLRRLLAQFGLTALIMALGAGAALADTAPAVAPSPSDTGSTVVTNDTRAVVDTTHTSTTTVGTSIGGSNGTGTTGTPTATPSTGSGPTDGNATGGTGDGTPSALIPTTPNRTPTVTSPTGSNGSPPASPATTAAQPTHNQLVASFERVAYIISGLPPVEPILAATAATGLGHPAPPASPPSPVGLLNQLHILLISTLVPATRFVQGSVHAAASSHAGLEVAVILVLACLALIRLTVPANTHTARLRRSGFLGAARSDVGGVLLSFATPREMSSIGAYAPG